MRLGSRFRCLKPVLSSSKGLIDPFSAGFLGLDVPDGAVAQAMSWVQHQQFIRRRKLRKCCGALLMAGDKVQGT